MIKETGFFARNFNWVLGLAIALCAVLLALSVASVVSELRAPIQPADKQPAGLASDATERRGAETRADEKAPPEAPHPEDAAESPDHPSQLDAVRRMQEGASGFYRSLREYARENPEADAALSEEEIREMEKAGAIPM